MGEREKVSVGGLQKKKRSGQAITMLTAYDYPMARFISEAEIDIVLVSDAVGTVGLGRPEAISVTVDEMIYHSQAVRNGAGHCMVVTTLPFGSYSTAEEGVSGALRIMREGHADGVHLEGTAADADKVRAIVDAGVPVLAHIGITKQKIVRSGAVRIQGRNAPEASEILADALAFARSGAFAIVLEGIPDRLAAVITHSLDIPTIGIGAGVHCDGQALVTQDMLGLFKGVSPRFLKVYVDLSEIIVDALSQFRSEVQHKEFPTPGHSYSMRDGQLAELLARLRARERN